MNYILCIRRFAAIHGKSPEGYWQFWSILTRSRNEKRPFSSLPTLLSKGIFLQPCVFLCCYNKKLIFQQPIKHIFMYYSGSVLWK